MKPKCSGFSLSLFVLYISGDICSLSLVKLLVEISLKERENAYCPFRISRVRIFFIYKFQMLLFSIGVLLINVKIVDCILCYSGQQRWEPEPAINNVSLIQCRNNEKCCYMFRFLALD